MMRTDWNEAERLWRSGAAMDEKLAMVERALTALGRGRRRDETNIDGAHGRGAVRVKRLVGACDSRPTSRTPRSSGFAPGSARCWVWIRTWCGSASCWPR